MDILLYCFVECEDWAVELREKHRLYVDIMRLAERLDVSFAFPTRTLHMYQEQHDASKFPTDGGDPPDIGRGAAAHIAGPLLSPGRMMLTIARPTTIASRLVAR